MIVCLCRGVTDQVVGAAIADGASTVTDVVAACGAGSDCGACQASLLAMLAELTPCRSGSYALRTASAHGQS